MRRKIALLLVFAMLISLIPAMSVSAVAPGAPVVGIWPGSAGVRVNTADITIAQETFTQRRTPSLRLDASAFAQGGHISSTTHVAFARVELVRPGTAGAGRGTATGFVGGANWEFLGGGYNADGDYMTGLSTDRLVNGINAADAQAFINRVRLNLGPGGTNDWGQDNVNIVARSQGIGNVQNAMRATIFADHQGYGGWLAVEIDTSIPNWQAARIDLPLFFSTYRRPQDRATAARDDLVRIESTWGQGGGFEGFNHTLARFEQVANFRAEFTGSPITFSEEIFLSGRIHIHEEIQNTTAHEDWRIDMRLVDGGFSWGHAGMVRDYENRMAANLANHAWSPGRTNQRVMEHNDRVNAPANQQSATPNDGSFYGIVSSADNRFDDVIRLDFRGDDFVAGHQDPGHFRIGLDGPLEEDHLPTTALMIQADDNARTGDVRVEVTVSRWDPTRIPEGAQGHNDRENSRNWVQEHRSTLVVARFGAGNIELGLVDGSNLEDYVLTSGDRSFEFAHAFGDNVPVRDRDNIAWGSATRDYHGTATLVVRETAIDVFDTRGGNRSEIIFDFPDGVEILGVVFSTNAAFNTPEDDVWFVGGAGRVGYYDVTIRDGSVSMLMPERETRPEFAQIPAEVRARFYLSVQPGFESMYGEELDVFVHGRGLGDFTGTQTIALIQDPIQIVTDPINVGDAVPGFGVLVAPAAVNDIRIYETFPGALRQGTTLWVGFGSLGWAEGTLSLMGNAAPIGDLRFSQRNRYNGIEFTITRESQDEDAGILISNVMAAGMMMPGIQHHVVVDGDAIGHNLAGWGYDGWVGWDRWDARVRRAEWENTLYDAPAFIFVPGALDQIGPGVVPTPPPAPPAIVVPTPPPLPQAATVGPATVRIEADGTVVPVFRTIPSSDLPNVPAGTGTTFIMAAHVADVLGLNMTWDAATLTGTFTDGVTTLQLTHLSEYAIVNGVRVPVMAHNNQFQVDARVIQGRFFVPVAFFGVVFPNVTVQWLGSDTGVLITW